jgi:hypothetical protein
MGMLAGWIWRDYGLGGAFGKPVAQALGVISLVGDEAAGAWGARQEIARAFQVMRVAGREQEVDWPPVIIRQRMDLRGAAAARAPDGVLEDPPFAPAAERCTLT